MRTPWHRLGVAVWVDGRIGAHGVVASLRRLLSLEKRRIWLCLLRLAHRVGSGAACSAPAAPAFEYGPREWMDALAMRGSLLGCRVSGEPRLRGLLFWLCMWVQGMLVVLRERGGTGEDTGFLRRRCGFRGRGKWSLNQGKGQELREHAEAAYTYTHICISVMYCCG